MPIRPENRDRYPADTCEGCGKALTGAQTRYCSRRCKSAVRRRDPAAAERQREHSRAWKDAHREENRARDRATQHRPCPNCGGARNRDRDQCLGCWEATVAVRRSLAEGMWADGWPLKAMAEAFGVTTGYFGCRRLRDGWDLPYRYNVRRAA